MQNKQKKSLPKRQPRPNKLAPKYKFSPLPNSMAVAIKYCTRIAYSSAILNVYNTSMSSLQTFQGFYRDQLLALYKNYVVLGFTVNYKIINTDVLGVQAEAITFDCPSSETAGLTFANLLEWPGAQKMLVSSTGNKMVIQTSRHYILPSIYKKDISADSDFWGTSTSAPSYADPQEHCIAIYSLDGISTVKLLIEREYVFHTRFMRRENPGSSLSDGANIKPSFPEKNKKPGKKVARVMVSDSD